MSETQTAPESRFDAAHYSEALTAFSVGWKDSENLAELIEKIAPTVHVPRRFEFKKADNAQSFLSETDDVRAIGGAFKRVEYTGRSVNSKTHNKGLTIRVDHDEISGDNWQERYVELLMQRLLRNELRRCIGILDKASESQDVVFDANSNPDASVRKALAGAADVSGVRPNRVLFSEAAWDARMCAYEAKDNSAGLRAAAVTPKQLSQSLLVDEVNIARARFQDSGEGKSPIVGKSVYAYFAQNGVTKDEPSNLKRFVTPSENGGNFRVYLEEHAKYTDITVEHYSNIVVTSDLGLQKLAISAQ